VEEGGGGGIRLAYWPVITKNYNRKGNKKNGSEYTLDY
jgi:hypothetical protein